MEITLTDGGGLPEIQQILMSKLRSFVLAASGMVIVATLVGCTSSGFGGKPSKNIEEIMETGFKGKDPALKGADSVAGRIRSGTASEADLQLMVDLTRQLTRNKPPKGELASWTAKTSALHAAAKDLAAHKVGALDGWKEAVNCKACHSVHKPD